MGVTTSGIIATVTSPAIGEEQRLCDDAISVLKRGERTVYLMGSAHISSESAVLAQQLVRTAKPDTIFVELDKKRVMGKLGGGLGDAGAGSSGSTGGAGGGDGSGGEGSTVASQSRVLESAPAKLAETNSARDSTRGNQLNPFSALKGKLVAAAGAGLGKLIGGMYKQLDSAGFTSGAEFVVAINEGLKLGSNIVLGDRDVDVTLSRLAAAVGKTDLSKVDLDSVDGGLGFDVEVAENKDGTIDKEALTKMVETMKARENVRALMNKLKREAPYIYEAMVGERDLFMGEGIDKADSGSMVAVVGIAHMDGIVNFLSGAGWKETGQCVARGK